MASDIESNLRSMLHNCYYNESLALVSLIM